MNAQVQIHGQDRFNLQIERLGPLPLVNHFIERIGLEEMIGQYVKSDARCAIPHARALGVLLRSFIVEREPVYRQQETVHGFASGMFGLSAKEMEHLGDDRLGRALDRLFDCDRAALLTEVVLVVAKRFGLRFDELHNDSTSISLCGSYRAATGRTIRARSAPAITYGHSKAHRPDLKQLLFHPHHECRWQRTGGLSLHGRQRERRAHPHRDLEYAAQRGWACRLPVRGRLQAVLAREHGPH
jgi:hypothetical protein